MASRYTNLNKSRKNLIVNGNFDIWQRNTSFSSMANNTYMADRFKWIKNAGTEVVSAVRNTTSPPAPYDIANFCLELNVDTADVAIADNAYCGIEHDIEGFTINQAYDSILTLSFMVRAWRAGIYTIVFQNEALDQSWNTEYEILASNTWQRIEVNVNLDQTGASWDWQTGVGLRVYWVLASGADYRTSNLDQWESANKWGSSNQVNAVGSTSDKFELSMVQLEANPVATEWDMYDFQDELARCQRYYCKSWNLGAVPGSTAAAGRIEGMAGGIGYVSTQVSFPVRMRANPTVTLWDTSGNSGQVRSEGAGNVAASAGYVGQQGFGYIDVPGDSLTVGEYVDFYYEADADF
jgi:hypothetical protein